MILAGLAALLVALPVPNAAAGADKTSPSTPQNLRVLSATQTSLNLVWDASTDDVAVEGYKVWFGQPTPSKPLDHQPSVKTPEAQFTATQLACGQSYQVEVVAYDHTNNLSEALKSVVSTAPCVDIQPPSAPTGLQQIAASATSATLAWSPSTDNVAVAGYSLSRVEIEFDTTSETSYSFSGLSCGKTYAVAVRAYDVARNYSGRANFYVTTGACGDVSPPTAPAGLVQTNKTTSGMSVAWSPSSDSVGVTRYDIFRDGTLAGSTSGVSYSFSGLNCGTLHTVGVEGVDGAGNRSARTNATMSTAQCVTPPPPTTDTQPPTTPTSLALVAALPTSVTLTWLPSTDNVAVTGYGTFRNGTPVQVVTGTTFVFQGLSCGTSHQLGVTAYDAKGNHSGTASVTASTTPCSDTSPPTLPQNLVVLSRTSSSATVSWSTSTDNVGVAGYAAYVGGQLDGSTSATSYTFTGLACNTSVFVGVNAYDAAGNFSSMVTIAVTTTICNDTQAPTWPSQLTVSGATQTGLTLNWAASSDNSGVAGYDVFVNGVKTATASATEDMLSNLTCSTTYTLGVQAFDGAGNRSELSTVSSSTLACSALPPPSGGSGNLAVSPSGSDSTCLRDNLSNPCKTFQRAYDLAQPGDTVSVQPGTYPPSDTGRDAVTIFGGPKSGSAPVAFECASSGTVTHSSIAFTINAFNVTLRGGCFRLHDLRIGEGGDAQRYAAGVVIDGVHMEGLEIVGAQATVRNSEIGPSVLCYRQGQTGTGDNGGAITPAMWCNPNGPPHEAFYAGKPQGSSELSNQPFFHNNAGGVPAEVTFESNYIHDVQTKDGFNEHTGGGLVWNSGAPTVMRGNRYERVAILGVQFTETNDVTFENNWMGPPVEPIGNCSLLNLTPAQRASCDAGTLEADDAQKEIIGHHSGTLRNFLFKGNIFCHGTRPQTSSTSSVRFESNDLGRSNVLWPGATYVGNINGGDSCP